MQDKLKKFSWDTVCIKCGCTNNASVKWLQSEDTIQRVCNTCGYWWHEVPLDKVKAPKNSRVYKETELDRKKAANKLRSF